MRIPKQSTSVDRDMAVIAQAASHGGVSASGELCSAFPELCGLGI
ncbi:MAG: hypothetical protein AAGC60_21300 [Acidobacteriota bacterium]